MVNIIHTNNNYRNVGTLEVLNEPLKGQSSQTDSMRQNYYPTAWKRIRAAESNLGIAHDRLVHIQMMVCFHERSCTSKTLNANTIPRTKNGAPATRINTSRTSTSLPTTTTATLNTRTTTASTIPAQAKPPLPTSKNPATTTAAGTGPSSSASSASASPTT